MLADRYVDGRASSGGLLENLEDPASLRARQ